MKQLSYFNSNIMPYQVSKLVILAVCLHFYFYFIKIYNTLQSYLVKAVSDKGLNTLMLCWLFLSLRILHMTF